jgi:hypothetical protein
MRARNDDDSPMLCEGDPVRVMHDSGEVIEGHIEIATNALWVDIEIVAVVKRDDEVTA